MEGGRERGKEGRREGEGGREKRRVKSLPVPLIPKL